MNSSFESTHKNIRQARLRKLYKDFNYVKRVYVLRSGSDVAVGHGPRNRVMYTCYNPDSTLRHACPSLTKYNATLKLQSFLAGKPDTGYQAVL